MRITLMLCLLWAAPVLAQTVKNPTRAVFKCGVDHDLHTGHELDLINAAGVVIQTLSLGTSAPDAAGDVTLPINVQPITFGLYTAKVRAVAGAIKSADSEASNVWERAPGQPSRPRVE